MTKAGILRYVLHKDLVRYLADGWIYAADLGPYTGQFSTLMWWCSGDCADGESPRYAGDKHPQPTRVYPAVGPRRRQVEPERSYHE